MRVPLPMRIEVINPNTTASMTDKIGAAARAGVRHGTEIIASHPDMRPVAIEGHDDEALSVIGVLTVGFRSTPTRCICFPLRFPSAPLSVKNRYSLNKSP